LSFFNDKENVIGVELTPHGKRLLRDGKFKPVYYSFEDEGIIYDSLYTDLTESQSEIENRILNESISTTPQITSEGIETAFKNNSKYQNENDRTYVNSLYALGTSDLKTQNLPAWDVNILRGEISSSSDFITGSISGSVWNIPVPQINLQSPNINVNIVRGLEDIVYEKLELSGLIEGVDYETLENNSIIEVEDDYILLSIDELNSVFQGENYDIEVFEVEQTAISGSSETLTPLYFANNGDREISNIWVEEDDLDINQEELTIDNVEYYLDIETDFEIPEDILCKYTKADKRQGIYGSRLLDCPEEEIENITIYDTDNDDIGENC
jgi:hypothetical protein